MRAGSLKDLVSLQQPGEVQDEIGQPIPGWIEVAKIWVNIRFLSGIETVKAGAPTSIAKGSIQARKRAGLNPAMRIVDADGVDYRFQSILPDKQHRDRVNLPFEVVS